MRCMQLAGIVLCAALLTGCTTSNKPPVINTAARPATLEQARGLFGHADPPGSVGWVAFVQPGEESAVVTDIPALQFKYDDFVTFLDPKDLSVICYGVVKGVGDTSLRVQYVTPEKRAPQAGDLAVLFLKPQATQPAGKP